MDKAILVMAVVSTTCSVIQTIIAIRADHRDRHDE